MNGIFVAIKKEKASFEISLELDTEDEEFRIIDLPGIIIEIRAFDTSYFEIYIENLDLIQKIALHYGTTISFRKLQMIESFYGITEGCARKVGIPTLQPLAICRQTPRPRVRPHRLRPTLLRSRNRKMDNARSRRLCRWP